MKKIIITSILLMLVVFASAQTVARVLAQTLTFGPDSTTNILDYVTNTGITTSEHYHIKVKSMALDEEWGDDDAPALAIRIVKTGSDTAGWRVAAIINQSKWAAPWPIGSDLRIRIWHIDDNTPPAKATGIEPYPQYECAEKIIVIPEGYGPINLHPNPADWMTVPGPQPEVTEFNFTVTSNYEGAAIYKDGADTGETTPWTFIGPTAEVAGVYTVVRDATTFVVQGTTNTSYTYDGAADATVTFIGTYTPAIAAGNPYPANGANFDIAHDAEASNYDLTWEAPIAGAVDGYKVIWNGGAPVDVGSNLTWQTPAIAEGTYTWMVIPYFNDPLPPAPAPGGKTTGFTREFAPLQAKLIAPQIKGDAVNTPTWTFTVTRQDPPVLPVKLSNFSAVLTAENFVKLSWRTQSETGMLGYRVYRGESDVQASSMMLPVLIPANNTSNVIDYTWVDSEVEVQHTYWYWLEAVEVNGTGQFYGPLTVRVEGEIPSVLPTITTMGNAYPNPFKQSSSTTIDVSIKEGENGTVTVYNILGQIVKTFKVNEGEHQINWNGKDARGNNCGSGIYFYKLSTPSTNMTKKMVIVK